MEDSSKGGGISLSKLLNVTLAVAKSTAATELLVKCECTAVWSEKKGSSSNGSYSKGTT